MTTIEELLHQDLANRVEWDEAPELRMILTHNGGPVVGRLLIPEYAWAQARVPEVLDYAADLLQTYLAPEDAALRDGSGCQGIMLFSETYMVQLPLDNVAARDQAEAQARDHKLYQHPKRVEMRMIWAFMADGREICLGQIRGEEIESMEAMPMDGAVPDAMRRLRDLMCDKELSHGGNSS